MKRNPHISPDYLPLICSELCSRLESTGQCRAQGKHSLIGNGVSSCINNRKLSKLILLCYIQYDVLGLLPIHSLLMLLFHTVGKKGSSLHSIVNERTGFSTSHLENSSTNNQCECMNR